ncbi:hypothetical protein CTX60_08675 [Campylobacter upsaliensis]|nr:hypothetical protein [Campylobacter upsaliensis]
MKKFAISIITALVLSKASAAGIPVIDTAAISEAVKAYAQQLKEYEQMLKDTLNFEKQMKEFGVDMTSITQILGDLNSMVSDMQSIYNDLTNIPDDFLGNVKEFQNACMFLQTQSPAFKNKINSMTSAIDNDFNRCIAGIRNSADITASIDEIMDKIDKTTDYNLKQQLFTQIENIKNAKAFVEQKANEEQANRLVAFYDTYKKKDKTNPYSKEKMSDDLKRLSKQLQNPNNAKQAQALTNTILLKMYENMQRQYELNMEYSNALVNITQKNGGLSGSGSYDLTEKDFQKVYTPAKLDEKFLIYKDAPQAPLDKNGFPVFQF